MSSPAASPAATPSPLPEALDLNALQRESPAQLDALATLFHVRNSPPRPRHALVNEIARAALARGVRVTAEGVVEVSGELGGAGIIRWPDFSFVPCPEDVFIPAGMMRAHGLRSGQLLSGTLRASPQHREKLMTIDRLLTVEGRPLEQWTAPKAFDALTAQFPKERIILESTAYREPTVRAIDLIATLGRGQRGLIVAPPRVGKTILLKHIAKAIRAAYPEIHLILLLVDERPEEVTDFKTEVDAEIFASTFDEAPARHIQLSELVGERAKRLVELGKHVVILLDSITRLARGHNAMASNKGRIMSGGVEAKALLKPKKFFSAARNTEEGGSLTVLATALVETNSRMDDVIFEEFKGTGNMELHLDRELVEKRVYPTIHIQKSGTRRDDLL
ncbi:MAG: transcription termination factor Rho, partial [Verrucomicrobia bacterium]|nr:transcription termination factor Rho [Verrucomicrobiota bacterium]